MEDLTASDLKKKIENKDDFLLIDVREGYEHEEFNIGGKLIPLGELMTALPELQEKKEEEIVVYCRSGNRSAMAKDLLVGMGFKNVRNLLGGMLDWQAQ